jgi:MoaA/NifB/PqqE/SkfB family radical SAM enzyme
MFAQFIPHTIKLLRTLQTDTIYALPIVILMPHSSCNCQCVMCDIWKGNKNLRQLTEEDIIGLLESLRKLGTKQVVMSGGEALLNSNFFRFCEILKRENIKITLLSTGLTIKRNAAKLVEWVEDIIVSLDGSERVHDSIRNIPGAYLKLKEGIQEIKSINPHYKITARTVIHRLNYEIWPEIIDSAKEIGLDQISFLPADVSSHAFNREILWDVPKQYKILIGKDELPGLQEIIESNVHKYQFEFASGFIAESIPKIRLIYDYYAAFYGLNLFPYKKCNAPWVSSVIEADGTVRPCFFHEPLGNIREESLDQILNKKESVQFRKSLDIHSNDTCVKCVCYLNLPTGMNPAGNK